MNQIILLATTAAPTAENTTGIPTILLVLLIMGIAIGSVAGIRWIYNKINNKNSKK